MKNVKLHLLATVISLLLVGCSNANLFLTPVSDLDATGNKVNLEGNAYKVNLNEKVEIKDGLYLEMKNVREETGGDYDFKPLGKYIVANYTLKNETLNEQDISELNLEVLDDKGYSHHSVVLLNGVKVNSLDKINGDEELIFEFAYDVPDSNFYKFKINLGAETKYEINVDKQNIAGISK